MGFTTESCVFQVGCKSVLFSVSEGESRVAGLGQASLLPCFTEAVGAPEQLQRHSSSLSLHNVSRNGRGGRTAVRFASKHPTNASPSSNSDWPGPHRTTVKPRSTQTLSLQASALKGMEEEFGSNKETLGKCSFTNTASGMLQLSAFSGCLLFRMCVMPWSVEGRGTCHLILPEVAAGSPGPSAFHCCCVISIMPELQKDLGKAHYNQCKAKFALGVA